MYPCFLFCNKLICKKNKKKSKALKLYGEKAIHDDPMRATIKPEGSYRKHEEHDELWRS